MKTHFDLSAARGMADCFMRWIGQDCERVEVVGQVRRECPAVNLIEVLYIPKVVELEHRDSPYFVERFNLVEARFRQMLEWQVVRHRKVFAPGPKRILTHPTGITAFETILFAVPVNYIETTQELWPHALVFHTGPMVFNNTLATQASRQGWIWSLAKNGLRLRRASAGGELPPAPVQVQDERGLLTALDVLWVEPRDRG